MGRPTLLFCATLSARLCLICGFIVKDAPLKTHRGQPIALLLTVAPLDPSSDCPIHRWANRHIMYSHYQAPGSSSKDSRADSFYGAVGQTCHLLPFTWRRWVKLEGREKKKRLNTQRQQYTRYSPLLVLRSNDVN